MQILLQRVGQGIEASVGANHVDAGQQEGRDNDQNAGRYADGGHGARRDRRSQPRPVMGREGGRSSAVAGRELDEGGTVLGACIVEPRWTNFKC